MSKPTRAKPPRAGLPPWEIRHRMGLHDQSNTTGTDQKAKTPVEFTVNRVELQYSVRKTCTKLVNTVIVIVSDFH